MEEEVDLTEEELKYRKDCLMYDEVDVLEGDNLIFNSMREAERYSFAWRGSSRLTLL